MGSLLERVERVVADTSIPPAQQLRMLIRAHVEAVASNLDALTVYLHEFRALTGDALEVVRQQGNVDRELGLDASLALTWRPFAIQNIVTRLSVAALLPGSGYKSLFGDEVPYSVLGNIVLTY